MDAAQAHVLAIERIWQQLDQFASFERAITAGPILSLSPGTAAKWAEQRTRMAPRIARAFLRRDDWEPGMAWLPTRRAFVGWVPAQDGLEVFEVSAGGFRAVGVYQEP